MFKPNDIAYVPSIKAVPERMVRVIREFDDEELGEMCEIEILSKGPDFKKHVFIEASELNDTVKDPNDHIQQPHYPSAHTIEKDRARVKNFWKKLQSDDPFAITTEDAELMAHIAQRYLPIVVHHPIRK